MKEKILSYLKTKWMGQNIIYYKSIDSTQKETYRLLKKEELKNGTVIFAEEQTGGIGTHDRKWYSGRNENISFTIILYPNCSIKKIERFTINIAECLIKSIKNTCGIHLQIKEPNDLVYKGKKVGGILTQSLTCKEIVKQIIIGIGINVNGTTFPQELENIAVSLKNIKGEEILREKIVTEFLNLFEEQYEVIVY